ncbi:hypothetical protein GCM10010836_32000 [Aminobacter aminovorans]
MPGLSAMALATTAAIRFMMMVKNPKNRHTASTTDAPSAVIRPTSSISCNPRADQALIAVMKARLRRRGKAGIPE